MGLPDLKNYYLASHLTRIIDWHCHKDTKDLVSLELGLNPIPLHFAPWIPWNSYPPTLKHHPLTGTTLEIFHRIAKRLDITSSLSPLMPLKDNPDFTLGMGNSLFQLTHLNRQPLAGDCLHEGKIKDLSILKQENNLPQIPFWFYLQICNYLYGKSRLADFSRPLTEFELVFRMGDQFLRATSITYTWL